MSLPGTPEWPADEAAAYELFERLRWGGAPAVCPHCATPGRCHFLRSTRADLRRTRTGAGSGRRVWKCGACRRQFSVLIGTVLQGTRISLLTWIAVVADRAAGDVPASARDLAERYGLTGEAARRMVRRLDLAESSAGRR